MATFAILLVGCGESAGPSQATVSGQVLIDGKPIEKGTITFFPEDKKLGRGGSAAIVGGDYTLNEVPLGKVAFTFSAAAETGKMITGPGGSPEPERINIIPMKYQQEGIERDISTDGTQDFALQSHP